MIYAFVYLTGPLAPLVEGSTGTDPVAILLNYGPLGMVVLGFILGWIVPGPTAKQLVEENRRLNALIETVLLPMIEKDGATLERVAGAMEKNTAALDANRVAFEVRRKGDARGGS